MRPARALTPWRKTLRIEAKGLPTGRRSSHQPAGSRASMTPVARPHSTGRVGAGTDAAGTVGGLASVPTVPARTVCRLCPDPAVPGDDLELCRSHGGLGPEWADFDEAAWLAGREAC